ncbi:MAG: EscU/YscU/HrcU family type III secretion system export apparatus switch protein [Gemmatimonadales bacterium]|nr:EscU/YscU/HrcU family type III secretion system export apparatus switch protein [Gemmatimonadales bacterium]
MSDTQQAQERTELPTVRRRQTAFDEGRVPRSPELAAAAGLLAGALALAAVGGRVFRETEDTLTAAFGGLTSTPLTMPAAAALVRDMVAAGLRAIVPVALAMFASIVLVAALQARGVWSAKPLAPDLSRISPLSGFRRLVSGQSVFTLFKAGLKLTVLGGLTYAALHGAWSELAGLGGEGAPIVAAVIRGLGLRLVATVGVGFLVVAALDYGFEVWQHERKLKMTRQEVVQELREQEGDPLLKSRVRSMARSMARRRMLHRVREAHVVVVNPIHVAVALKYDPGHDGAPVVLAMGRRKLAQRIKELARAAGVPLVENPTLARALIATAAVGKPIPPALYVAVAEVLAWVYRRRGRRLRSLAAAGSA